MNNMTDLFGLDKRKPEDIDKTKYVVRRREDSKYADDSNHPTAALEDAQVFDSKPLAALWADKISAARPGTWQAIEHPGAEDPNDDPYDPAAADAAYGKLPRRAA